ncbi:MAG TPA: TonB-dependent receptor [Casimicrobiaceae bacterium]
MNFKRSKVATALAAMAGLGGALAMTAVNAQQAPAPAQGTPEIKIEVTGSAIRRVEGETALPVQIITRDEIEKTGATTAMQLMQTVSANNSLGSLNLTSGVGISSANGEQSISLRGLSPQHTLVLINGHRIEGFPGEGPGVAGQNLSAIPISAIERVEVLKDGASAIYGSDAVAGVVNFITRSDYTGGEVTGYYAVPSGPGDGKQWTGNGTLGFGNLDKDKYNVFATLSYLHQNSLLQKDRNYSNSSFNDSTGQFLLSSNQFPGNITTGGIGVVNHGIPNQVQGSNGCGFSRNIVSQVYGPLGCWFDPARAPGVEMIPDEKTWNAFAKATVQLNDNWQADLTGLYSHDESHLIIQPGPISSSLTYGPFGTIQYTTITLQPDSPFYPHAEAAAAGVDGKPLNVKYRSFENGNRDTTDTNEHKQIIANLQGSINNWDVRASGYYTEGTTKENINGGFQDLRKMLPILNSGVVDFFNFNTPDIVHLLHTADFTGSTLDSTNKVYGAEARASGDIFKLPAGTVQFSAGASLQKQTFDQVFPSALQGGYITGFGGTNGNDNGSRTQYAAYAEFNVPIVKTLEGDVQVRYDHYSDFGSTTNPKYMLRWQPTKALLFRGSWGTGFLAPSLYQLHAQESAVSAYESDPIRCPVTHSTDDCHQQFPISGYGNANLKPEKSEQATAGVVFSPTPNVSGSLDFFRYNVSDFITNGISPSVILNPNFYNQYSNLVTRGAPTPDFPDLPGRIANINGNWINLGAVRIQGVDVSAHYRAPEYNWGRLTFDINGTYFFKWDSENPDGSFASSVSNNYGTATTGVLPRWKHYATLTWDRGPWSATLAQTFQTAYVDQFLDFHGQTRKVGSLSIWDLQTTYSGVKNMKLTLGVKNLLNTNPPATNEFVSFIAGFDPSYYDPRGQFFYGSINYKFK